METHESRKKKLDERVRKGRPICVQGYIREYRKDDSDSPYRAIVASDFTTRKDRQKTGGVHKRVAQRRATRKLIRRQITDNYNGSDPNWPSWY